MAQTIKLSYYNSPIGLLRIGCSDHLIHEVFFEQSKGVKKQLEKSKKSTSIVYIEETAELHIKAIQQFEEYFSGSRFSFELPIEAVGTVYQTRVWKQLQVIPYAHTISYLNLAKAVSSERHCRAVANVNSKNPISIIIPCHRVIQSDGSIGGYAGELWRKEWLIKHENKNNPKP